MKIYLGNTAFPRQSHFFFLFNQNLDHKALFLFDKKRKINNSACY